jgi:XcyI-like restriction endonuclease
MSDEQSKRREAHRLNYQLRSTFFYRKLKEYQTLSFPARVAALFPHEDLYEWSGRAAYGVGEDAFAYIKRTNLNYLQVFCHPKALREHPELVAYYRNIAALSQKSVKYLTGIEPKRYESDRQIRPTLNEAEAQALAKLFNEHITLIVDSSILSITERELEALLFASTGAQIDGSWRNRIGEEAEHLVQRLLVKEAVRHQLVQAFIRREKSEIVPFDERQADELLSELETYRGIMLASKTSILFASEPDIALIAHDGATIAAIEVKGGTDPAGALERYGAAKKSFEKTLVASPNARTIFVANSITPEVRQRLSSDRTVTKFFDLAGILSDSVIAGEFRDYIFGLLEPNTK